MPTSWNPGPGFTRAHGPYRLTAATMNGRSLGIVGLGRIGESTAARAVAFRYYPDLLAMARDVDTLVVATPGGAGTRRLVDRDVLAALGRDGVLVNVARGSVVDERALVEALRCRTMLAAGLDVYEHEPEVPEGLLDADNAVLLPHVGSASEPTRRAMGRLVAANLEAWFERGQPLTPVPESSGLVRA